MQDLADTSAHLPAPDLAIAISDAIRDWYSLYNNGTADLNHTLMCSARVLAGLITETPFPDEQRRALELLASICGMNVTFKNQDRYGFDPHGAIRSQAFH
jgi:hypothetical protein